MKVELTESQYWLIMRGLAWLSSEQGAMTIAEEFPEFDEEEFAMDIDCLASKLHMAASKPGEENA